MSCFLEGATSNSKLAEIFASYQADSEEVDLGRLEGRGKPIRLKEAALHLLSPLL